jgi:hypothetical protein
MQQVTPLRLALQLFLGAFVPKQIFSMWYAMFHACYMVASVAAGIDDNVSRISKGMNVISNWTLFLEDTCCREKLNSRFVCLIFQNLPCERCVNIPRCYTVNANSTLAPLAGKVSCQLPHSRLCHGVNCPSFQTRYPSN